MPRHPYYHLEVSCFTPRIFTPDTQGLRAAVEHLRSIERTAFVGITVKAKVQADKYRLDAAAFLKLEQIEGKRPTEVWEIFDRKVDAQIDYYVKRATSGFKP